VTIRGLEMSFRQTGEHKGQTPWFDLLYNKSTINPQQIEQVEFELKKTHISL